MSGPGVPAGAGRAMRPPGALRGVLNRVLQQIALVAPGAKSVRVRLHRLRGVAIGSGVFIGMQALIETAYPQLVSIGDRCVIGIRTTILAHFDGDVAHNGVPDHPTVRIEDDAFVGPGAIIMPNVTIGRGSVVAAGSVVSRSIPPGCFARGNPATIVARCTKPLSLQTPTWVFVRGLVPIRRTRNHGGESPARGS